MNIDEGMRRLVIGIIWAAFLLGVVALVATANLVLGLAVSVTVVVLFYIALYVANGFLKKDNNRKNTG
ncbi:MAG: hypothetical protein ACYST6_04710 [Planctomycetota bacterium]|jgi:heme A synthase